MDASNAFHIWCINPHEYEHMNLYGDNYQIQQKNILECQKVEFLHYFGLLHYHLQLEGKKVYLKQKDGKKRAKMDYLFLRMMKQQLRTECEQKHCF